MDDWPRRDQMRKEGKTVRALTEPQSEFQSPAHSYPYANAVEGVWEGFDGEAEGEGEGEGRRLRRLKILQQWDNTAWSTLSPR